MFAYIFALEVLGPVGHRVPVGSPSGMLDFVLCALQALRLCDPRNSNAVHSEKSKQKFTLKFKKKITEKSKKCLWEIQEKTQKLSPSNPKNLPINPPKERNMCFPKYYKFCLKLVIQQKNLLQILYNLFKEINIFFFLVFLCVNKEQGERRQHKGREGTER